MHQKFKQRYQIQAYLEAGKTHAAKAVLINKYKSVVSRELKRNTNAHGFYKARQADELSQIKKEG